MSYVVDTTIWPGGILMLLNDAHSHAAQIHSCMQHEILFLKNETLLDAVKLTKKFRLSLESAVLCSPRGARDVDDLFP